MVYSLNMMIYAFNSLSARVFQFSTVCMYAWVFYLAAR